MRIALRNLFYFLVISVCISCANTNVKKEDSSLAVPKITKPIVRRIWVPDEIRDSEYIMGHWKYLLKQESTWSR